MANSFEIPRESSIEAKAALERFAQNKFETMAGEALMMITPERLRELGAKIGEIKKIYPASYHAYIAELREEK